PMNTVVAKTHPREYRLHKYWSRKPHNVVRHFVGELIDEPGVVVDPFCGSGVAVREASKLGHRAYGFDVNPVAVNLSRVTTDPPPLRAFCDAVRPVVDGAFAELCREAYAASEGDEFIRYVVHETVVECACGARVDYSSCERDGRRYLCRACGESVRLNLKGLVDTRVHGLAVPGAPDLVTVDERCARQAAYSARSFCDDTSEFDYPFVENRRILAHDQMRTSSLFTRRNFTLLCRLARQFHALDEPAVRRAALCLLTASVAQCSRLIPYRSNMSTG
ncbi:MAG: DNA methyltransferase, partial [Persicimonas sp.]